MNRTLAGTFLVTVALMSTAERSALAIKPSQLRVRISVDLSADQGQAVGSLWESVNSDGVVFAGAGFLNAYNTQDRSDRQVLQVYAKTAGQPAFATEQLPRPSSDAGTYLYGFDAKLYSYGRNALDKALRVWNPSAAKWEVNRDTPALAVTVQGKVMSASAQRISYGDQAILEIPPEQGRLGEWYYATGKLIVRYFSGVEPNDHNELIAYDWAPGQTVPLSFQPKSDTSFQSARLSGKVQPLSKPGEFIYCFGQLWADGEVNILAASNQGGVHLLRDGQWQTLRVPDGKSFQIYASLNYENRLLLGQYPTGELFELADQRLVHLPNWPPVMNGVSRNAREAQTLAIFGGDLYVGVWPWGELWQLSSVNRQWQFLGRLFTHPEPTDRVTHPYETEMTAFDPVLNRWGQRVTSMLPMGDSLYISTSAKGPNSFEEKFTFLGDGRHLEYGAVHRYRRPGCLSLPIQWKAAPTQLEFILTPTSIEVRQDGSVLGRSDWAADYPAELAAAPEIRVGRGVFGRFTGQQLSVDLQSNGSEAAKFHAAYLHPQRMFAIDSSSTEQRETIVRELEKMQKFGLSTIMPFVSGSSGEAYYDSQLMPRRFLRSDPLSIMAQEARRRGIAFCPVMPVMVSGGDQPQGILLERPDWALRDSAGNSLGYLCPANGEARQWLVSVSREIVRHLEPDEVLLDYLRYANRVHRLDAESERRFRADLPDDCTPEVERVKLQQFKEDELTELARMLSESIRTQAPGIPLAAYVWGPHVVQDHLIAQVWPRWVELGYLDMINVSGYCHREKYGDRFLEEFRKRMQRSIELNQRLPKPARLTFALGVKSSHGSVQSADDICDYQRIADELSMDGVAYFTWEYLQPFLDQLIPTDNGSKSPEPSR